MLIIVISNVSFEHIIFFFIKILLFSKLFYYVLKKNIILKLVLFC